VSAGPDCVLDAPALLAFLREEPGADAVEGALEAGAAISAVNWAEVLSRTAEVGEEPDALAERLQREGSLGDALQVVSLDAADGPEIARLRLTTRERGLSLADRACLALAQRLALPALTTDRAWAGLELAVTVELVRP
jgi:ribonuclease VapC